jgi:hypothetical protein
MRKRSKRDEVRPRGGSRSLLQLAWDLDESTPEEAWTRPWRSVRSAAQLCWQILQADASAAIREVRAWKLLQRPGAWTYEEAQAARFDLPTAKVNAREMRWLRAGCLILEAALSNSSAGGELYGQLLLSAGPFEEVDQAVVNEHLLNARTVDAFGRFGRDGLDHVQAFREAWRSRRYRLAYLLAEASQT